MSETPEQKRWKNKPWREPTSTHVAYSSRNYFCLFSFNIFLTLLSLIMVITSLIIITATFLILRSTWKFSLCTFIQMPFSCFFFFPCYYVGWTPFWDSEYTLLLYMTTFYYYDIICNISTYSQKLHDSWSRELKTAKRGRISLVQRWPS